MVFFPRIAGLLFFGCLLCGPIGAQRQFQKLTPATAARQLMSELEKDSRDYCEGVRAIISTSLKDGEYQPAFEALTTLSSREQLEPLHYICAVAIKTGRKDEARIGLNLAFKLLLEDSDDRDTRSLEQFAIRAIDLGDSKLASKFIDAIKDDAPRKTRALISLAQHYLKLNEKAAAVVTLTAALDELKNLQVEDAPEFLELVPKVTKLIVEIDGRDKALEFLRVADQTQLPESNPRQQRYKAFRSAAFASIGDFEQAVAITESQEGEAKREGLIALALAYGESGNARAALSSMRYARDIADTSEDDNMLSRIVSAYLKLGRLDEAFAVLREMNWPHPLIDSAIELAQAYHKVDRKHDAVAALDVALLETQKMISEKAEEIPGMASSSIAREKSMGLSRLARAYLDLAYFPNAEKAVAAIDQPQFKARLWSQLAMAYHKSGEPVKAKSFLNRAFSLSSKAQEYNHDFRRMEVLVAIAEAFAAIGAKREAGEVILQTLTLLRDEGNDQLTIDALINIGRVCEKSGIPTSKSAQSLLVKIVKQYREDN